MKSQERDVSGKPQDGSWSNAAQRFLKYDLWTCSISVTWGLVKNAGSWAHPGPPEEETLGVGHPSEKDSSDCDAT